MGCASGQKEQTQTLRLNTVNGILKVTIFNAKIEHQTSSFFSMDPYIKLKVSNQLAKSKVVAKGGKQPVFNESFQFFINSCYQINGRNLQVQLWDSNKTSDSLIGFGITDLDPILLPNIERKPKPMKIFLNYDVEPAGWINAEVQFKEQPIQLLSFRFQTVSIRRKTSTLSDMNCFVKVTIGEQVLKTKKKKDTKEMPPVWIDDILTFNVPKVIKNCIIEVYDEKNLVGQHVFKIEDLLKESKQKQYDQDIQFEGAIAGTLRFQTIIGQRPQFSEIKRDYKRKIQQKPKEPTKQQKKLDDKSKPDDKLKPAQKQQKTAEKPKQPQNKIQKPTQKPKQEPKKQ